MRTVLPQIEPNASSWRASLKEPDLDKSKMQMTADALALIGRLRSHLEIQAQIAQLSPTEENIRAWYKSAARLNCADQQDKAWAALTAKLSEAGKHDELKKLSGHRHIARVHKGNPVPKIAAIMDEFTTACYEPECAFLPLSPEMAITQLQNFEPDVLLVESAWHGNDYAWAGQISNTSAVLKEVVKWCRNQQIPTVFWNKEDPVHFSTYLTTAKLFDFVFTTDFDCIGDYKEQLGHENVFLLPFAAQPKLHNPIATMDRKDAFNFAGAYYRRFLHRRRDMDTLIDTVSKISPVEIFDRNFGAKSISFTFPEKYKPYILGKLPFSEIDKAYKGYRYGINMNSVKESQSMFARRVYELLASNSVVVSNFSRAARNFFGDLIVSSDNGNRIEDSLAAINKDEATYRKFRLLGLRKVMSEHTYTHRVDYVMSKLKGVEYKPRALPGVSIIAVAKSPDEQKRIIESFKRQSHERKHLYLKTAASSTSIPNDPEITFIQDRDQLTKLLQKNALDHAFWGVFCASDYYGENYLTDLCLASRYSDADGFSKTCQYVFEANGVSLTGEMWRYCSHSNPSPLRSTLLRWEHFEAFNLSSFFEAPEQSLVDGLEILGIDEFNYCRDGFSEEMAKSVVDDLQVCNQGISAASAYRIAEQSSQDVRHLRHASQRRPRITAEEFVKGVTLNKGSPFTLQVDGDNLVVESTTISDRPQRFVMHKKRSLKELNLRQQSAIFYEIEQNDLNAQLFFEFFAEERDSEPIGKMILKVDGMHALAIPNACNFVTIGMVVRGAGTARLRNLVFGQSPLMPPKLLSRSDTLVLSKQYPSYDDLYKYGFLHSRVRAYDRAGQKVDIFRLNSNEDSIYREFENIDVVSGDLKLLDRVLESGVYRKVLVHILDRPMWDVLKKHLEKVEVIVWMHGSEAQAWQRRSYEFSNLTDAEIQKKKKLSVAQMKLWNEVFQFDTKNLRFVCVSENFVSEVAEDVGNNGFKEKTSIIHNYIDRSIFQYEPKKTELRKRVLTIRPYVNLKYANDLTVSAILELSKRPCFKDMEFTIAGDGELFDQTTAPLRKFSNVKLHKGFFTQAEIAQLHKEHGVFLTPTRWDSQGVSRDEAMSSGLVPITTNVAAVPEFVDETCGFLAPPENHIELANAMEKLYNEPELFSQKSNAAASRVRNQSGYDQTISRELELISPRTNNSAKKK